ncbi:SpoIID/LytB domain-containing protein [Haloplasma contractile]|uniref:Sporulation protein-like protein n=1 Tax=Haloplasma contractile SSD-17B TaxID=1033810 RepID=F7PWL6_9MOLU|nr:SpoIID/LytB domain-containing protein [Haloplasma contractile]ERJ12613.1 Sporulation protein-like protein [Haloplasma contractile SSD-17B]
MIDLNHRISYENDEAVLNFSIGCVQANPDLNFDQFSQLYNLQAIVNEYFREHDVPYSGNHLKVLYKNKLVKILPFKKVKSECKRQSIQQSLIMHTILQNDTIKSIAAKYNTTCQSLLTLNQKTEWQLMTLNQIKVVPNATQMIVHITEWGDTLTHISLTYHANLKLIKEINGIESIQPDQLIIIPSFNSKSAQTESDGFNHKNKLIDLFETSFKELIKTETSHQLYCQSNDTSIIRQSMKTNHSSNNHRFKDKQARKTIKVDSKNANVISKSNPLNRAKSLSIQSKTPKKSIFLPEYITVRHSNSNKIYHYSLEDYLIGTVAGQVELNSHYDFIKAIAIICRTYIIEKLYMNNKYITSEINTEYPIATIQSLKNQWKGQTDEQLSKIKQAIIETHAKVITYKNKPIKPFLFSSCNGYTMNSEDSIISTYYPYLRSVKSMYDHDAQDYTKQKTIPLPYLNSLLSTNIIRRDEIKVTSYTDGRYVKEIQIGNLKFSGIYLYDKLKLASPCFEMKFNGNKLSIITYGNGHCVGFSKYGANQLVNDKHVSYSEILKYYFKNTNITNLK